MKCLRILVMMAATMATALPAYAATVTARIDISRQDMIVTVGKKVVGRWKVSTGRAGYGTPTGTFRAQRLERSWYSRKYDMAPMPHSIFFYGGYAIHGTTSVGRLGRRASHGCVRLHPSNAARLYSLVRQHGMGNTRVVITQ